VKEGIHINQTIAGDGANDLPMLNLAGLGTFHAKLTKRKAQKVLF
jgi:phosphoserine phosphatase